MKLTESRYTELCGQYAGFCSTCDDVTRDSGTEPDARNYGCPKCGQETVSGIEEAFMMGELEIVDAEEDCG